MKKSAVVGGVVVVLVAAWLGATWYTGKRLEAEAPARLDELNQRLAQSLPDYGLKFEQISFERGFFSSHARYGLTMVGKGRTPDQPAVPAGVLQFDAVAYHGPLPLQALAHGSLMPQLAWVHGEVVQTDGLKDVFEATHGKTPLWSDTAFSYGGDTHGTGGVAPFDFVFQGHKAAFGGMQVQSSYTRSTQGLQSTMVFPSLTLEGADLGNGQLSIKTDMQSLVIDPLVWKNDKGEGRAVVTVTGQVPPPGAQGDAAKPVIQSVSARVVLSKPMLGELGSRYLAAMQGMSPQDADHQAARQLAGLSGVGQMLGLVRNDGDNLVSELQYANGKLSLNGRERDVGQVGRMVPGIP
ncbi:MAG TPA: YdgA family protein [Bordetella sp.]